MTPQLNTQAGLSVLRTAPLGSDEILDAVEQLLDAGLEAEVDAELLERGAREAEPPADTTYRHSRDWSGLRALELIHVRRGFSAIENDKLYHGEGAWDS
jgi:hypothetical protein